LTYVTETLSKPASRSSRPRVAAVVALTLLEVLRRQDRPAEILESEDTTITLPRRLGLSDAVDQQIRRYREEVRRGVRIGDDEVKDLVRLVIRRPDAEEVFFRTGRLLAGNDAPQPGWRKALPASVAYALARREAARKLRRLFGRRLGGFATGPFMMEGRSLVFIQSDPGGDACNLMSGFCQSVLDHHVVGAQVVHSLCESRKDPLCRWTVLGEEKVREAEHVPDLLLNPELS
jgi:hypothetical protein